MLVLTGELENNHNILLKKVAKLDIYVIPMIHFTHQ